MTDHERILSKAAWISGFNLCRSYGDNWGHFQGEQLERMWQIFLKHNDPPITVQF